MLTGVVKDLSVDFMEEGKPENPEQNPRSTGDEPLHVNQVKPFGLWRDGLGTKSIHSHLRAFS